MNLDFNTNLTEEQRAFIDTARNFANSDISQYAIKWDRDSYFPENIFKKAGQLGLGSIYVPESEGGTGLSRLDASLIFEELAYACPSTSAFLTIHNMATWMLSTYGNKELKEKYLQKLISMQNIASYCLTEPSSGSDASSLRTRGIPNKDNSTLSISGSKAFISGAGVSDLYFVMMQTGLNSKDQISCVLLEKETTGLSFGKNEEKMGWKNQPTRAVIMDNCKVSYKNIVGKDGEGFKIAMQGLDGGRINIASCSLGAARYCIDRCLNYVNERKQFGKFLKDFQSIQFKISDMITDYKAAQLMVHDAAKSLDSGDKSLGYKSAMAKKFATDACFKICNEALQIHGGYGYLSDFGIEKMVRDCRVHQILEGTNEIMKIIISRKFLSC